MSIIEIKNVSFGYSEAITLKNINLTVNKGDFLAVAGENGAGKSTLLRIIRGLLKPDSGDVFIDGQNISKIKVSSLAGKIGFLFQNPDRQLCKTTIRDELLFTLKNTIKDKGEREKLCDEELKSFGFQGDDSPFEMSRGEKQKIALASTIVSKPDILILDEPTTGLNYFECSEMMKRIKELNQNGCTVIMVCHDMEVLLDYALRVIVMDKGEIIADGGTEDIFFDENILNSSAVLPPQIIGLSMYMGNPYGRISSVDAMADAIEKERKSGK